MNVHAGARGDPRADGGYAARRRPRMSINFSLLPMAPADMALLQATLGEGPVRLVSRGYGDCRVIATAARNVWSVQYTNAMDAVVLDTLEIVDAPAAVLAADEDFADSSARLARDRATPISHERVREFRPRRRPRPPEDRMECGVCWRVYDPAEGDPVWQIPRRHAVRRTARGLALPELRRAARALPGGSTHESGRRRGRRDGLDARSTARSPRGRWRGCRSAIRALGVAALGFREVGGEAVGIVVTPWFMNVVAAALPAGRRAGGAAGRDASRWRCQAASST